MNFRILLTTSINSGQRNFKNCKTSLTINRRIMKNESFTTTIEVSKPPHDVFIHITDDVAKWWGGKDLEGNSRKLNDEFIIHHPGAHYSKQKLVSSPIE